MKAARKLARSKLGSLKNNAVSPGVQLRYASAVKALLHFWNLVELSPSNWLDINRATCEFVEAMWLEGEPHSAVSDALAGLMYFAPEAKPHLKPSWKLLKIWQRKEPPRRVLPLSPLMVLGIAGIFTSFKMFDVTAVLLVAFDCFLRTGEFCGLTGSDIQIFGGDRAVIKLAHTKTSLRKVGMEMVVCECSLAIAWLKIAMRNRSKNETILRISPAKLRRLFKEICRILDIEGMSLYSFRRGGATWNFLQHGSMEKTLLRGRWQSTATARIYLNDSAAQTADVQLSKEQVCVLKHFASLLVSKISC